ncbi:hypothetical protein IAQ61_002468 [Plenodomus lingam]|uniref:uncharacterized protein n=1 Tax=Leptosphaeria maculans TaxID=5022 RepID=UPI003326EE30|nr:hypothetical protein IAQ61_002468 [Plenodomus lingam]
MMQPVARWPMPDAAVLISTSLTSLPRPCAPSSPVSIPIQLTISTKHNHMSNEAFDVPCVTSTPALELSVCRICEYEYVDPTVAHLLLICNIMLEVAFGADNNVQSLAQSLQELHFKAVEMKTTENALLTT